MVNEKVQRVVLMLNELTRQERAQANAMAVGQLVSVEIIASGAVRIVGHGYEFASQCETYSCVVNNDTIASRASWEQALDDSMGYVDLAEHGDDFDNISQILSFDSYDWQECVARSSPK